VPAYEYQCKCGKVLSVWYGMIPKVIPDNEVLFCPDCRKVSNFKKIMSAPNFIVKGFSEKNGYSDRRKDDE